MGCKLRIYNGKNNLFKLMFETQSQETEDERQSRSRALCLTEKCHFCTQNTVLILLVNESHHNT